MRLACNPPQRRYLIRVFISMTAYLLTLLIAIRFVRDGHMSGPLAWLLAALPGIAVTGVFWAIGRLLVEETDEYQRMLLVRQSLVASAFALSIATVWGFLENARLVGHVDAFYVAILWFIGLGVGRLVNRLTLGDGGDQC
ncbi:MAG: hypothetical protein M3N02_04755 [Pseudomonadota bacterium]|nr:hypothetical protein [Pseudomonadota bacterium]